MSVERPMLRTYHHQPVQTQRRTMKTRTTWSHSANPGARNAAANRGRAPLSRGARGLLACGMLLCSVQARGQAVTVEAGVGDYEKVSGVSGNLNSIGSDTLNDLMTLWAEGFKAQYPNVNIQIEGKGSSTAPPALIAGTSQLGPMSRQMKAEEIDQFEKKYGYKPTVFKVAVDALAVYVNKDNPIKGLTMQQVDAIFSSTRKRGGKEIAKWGEAGLTGDWASKPISLYGRNSASGTYG